MFRPSAFAAAALLLASGLAWADDPAAAQAHVDKERAMMSRVRSMTSTCVRPAFLNGDHVAIRWIFRFEWADGSVTRIDPKTNKAVATIEVGIPGGGGDLAAGEGSVWATSFGFPISRIDPKTNTVVQQFTGDGGDALRVGLGSVWLSNLRAGTVWRIDPKKLMAVKSE